MRRQTTMRKILIIALAGIFGALVSGASAQTFANRNGKLVIGGNGGTDLTNTLTLTTTGVFGSPQTYTFPVPSAGLFHSTAGGLLSLGAVALGIGGDVTGILLPINGGSGVNNGTNTLTIIGGNVTINGLTTLSGTSSGTNTGDVTLAGENYLSLAGQVITANPVNLTGSNITGLLKATSFPVLTGDVSSAGGTLTTSVTKILGNTVPANAAGALINNGTGTLSWTSVPTGSGTVTGTNTGDVTLAGPGNYLSLTGQQINQALITYANMQATGAASVLLGRNSGSAGTLQEITLGSGLAMSAGGVLSASGTLSGGGTANTLAMWTGGTALGNSTITDAAGTLSTTENFSLTGSGSQLSLKGTSTGVSTFQSGVQGATTYNYTLPITTPTANQVLTATAITGAGPFAVTLGWSSGGGGLSGLIANGAMYATGATTAASTGAMTSGQILIGSTGIAPVLGTLTGTANQIIVANGAGSITLTTPQNIHTGATPTFAGLTLTGLTAQPGVVHNSNAGLLSSSAVSLTTDVSGILPPANGGTGVANANTSLLTLGGPVTFAGAFASTFTVTNTTNVTFPTSGTLLSSTGGGLVSGLITNAPVYAASPTSLASTAALLANGQLLIGTGVAPVAATLTAGSGVSITNGAGTITIATSSPVVFARKTALAPLTAANVNLQPDGDLTVPLVANATYEFSGVITYNGSASTSDLKLGLAFTVGTVTSIRWSADQAGTALAPSSVTAVATATTTGTLGTNIIGPFTADVTSTNELSIFISGIIVVGGTGGNLQVLESQNTSQAATTSIRLNSHLKATRVQ